MSGILGLAPRGYLPTLYGSLTTGTSLLATLYGQNGASAGTVNPIAALEQAKSRESAQVKLVAAEPQVKRDLALFTQAVADAKTPAQLLANPTALKVLLTANGLGDQVKNTALATQALLSDPAKPGSLVTKLADTRWLTLNKALAFASTGISTLKNPATISTVTSGYAEVLWRTKLDQTTPGLSNALDFLKRASTLANVDQVLGDPTFRDVITTTLGVPKEIAFQTLTAQEHAISSRIDLTKFKDSAYVNHFVQRYLVAAAQKAAQATNTAPTLTTLASQSAGIIV